MLIGSSNFVGFGGRDSVFCLSHSLLLPHSPPPIVHLVETYRYTVLRGHVLYSFELPF